MKRWACPKCGRGVNAPAKLARMDTRRWCLSCSASSPTLVERFMPAAKRGAELRREQRTEAEARRRDRAAERAREAAAGPPAYPGPWLLAWIPVVEALPWPRVLRRIRADKIDIRTRRPPRNSWSIAHEGAPRVPAPAHAGTSGRAWPGSGHITMTVGSDRAHALEVLVHEVAHLATPLRHHDRRYREVLAAAGAALTGREIEPFEGACWALDSRIAAAISLACLDKIERPSVEIWRAALEASQAGTVE